MWPLRRSTTRRARSAPSPWDRAWSTQPPALVATELEARRVLNAAPVLAGANDLSSVAEDATDDPGTAVADLISGQITDADPGDPQGIAIIGANAASGTWHFTLDNGENWTALGAVSNTSATLLPGTAGARVRFTPDADFNGTISPALTIRAWDGSSGADGQQGVDVSTNGGATAFSSATAAADLTVTPLNDAPVLSGANNLTSVIEDDGDPPGDLVSALISGQMTDVDAGAQRGIAVTGVDDTNGTWEYSTNGGANWTALGTVSDSDATLLAANATTRVRFVPDADFDGSVSPGLTFRGWDRTSGANGDTGVDVSANGGITAFSSTSASSAVSITPVNDAPVLGGANDLTSIIEDATSPVGDLISTLLAGQVTDPDTGALQGIAVIGVDDTNGVWQYTINGGANFFDIGPVTNTSARLLAVNANTRVRFVPDANYNGTVAPGITFRAWDRTSGANGDSGVDVSTNGGATAFSTATAASDILVVSINDPPVLAGANPLDPVTEDDTDPPGTLVSDLVAGQISDNDAPSPEGIAVIGVDSANGTWQYSTNGGTNWTTFGALSNTSATLLAANALNRVRFVPNANFSGTVVAGLTFRAWDQNSGVNGSSGVDVSTNGGTTAFSSSTASASVTVVGVNDAPILAGANNLTAIDEDATNSSGTLVSALLTGQVTEVDAGAVSGIAVTAVNQVNGTWQYTIDNGANWLAFGALSNTSATLLAANADTRVRFVPNANFSGAINPGITFRAWDQTSGANGATGVDVSVNGGTTAFSTATASSAINVRPVADTPTLVVNPTLAAGTERIAVPLGISGQLTDLDGSESLSFIISGLATTDVLLNDNGDVITGVTSTTLTPAQLVGLRIVVPDDKLHSNFQLSVVARSTETLAPQPTADSPAQAIDITIANAAPVITSATVPAGSYFEGDTITLNLVIDDATTDLQLITVDWGDGTGPQVFGPLNPGPQALQHTYYDNANYTITVTTVDDGLLASLAVATNVQLANLAPQANFLPVTPIIEGETATVIGTIADAGLNDLVTVAIDWGNGNLLNLPSLAQASWALNLLQAYPDVPEGAVGGTVHVQFILTDDDGGQTVLDVPILVHNYAPVPGLVTITPDEINENQEVQLDGQLALNPLVVDTFVIVINWGDGSPPTVLNLPNGQASYSAQHVFTDDRPSSTSEDIQPISISITDDELQAVPTQSQLTINNVAPTLSLLEATQVTTLGETTLTLGFNDPGTDSFVVRVDWSDGQVQFIGLNGPGIYQFEHQYFGNPDIDNPSAPIKIEVRVSDDDQGAFLTETTATVIGTGISVPVFILPSTPPILLTPAVVRIDTLLTVVATPLAGITSADLTPTRAEAASASALQVGLRIVSADGKEEEVSVFSPDILDSLPELFAKLPDNHYRLYLKGPGGERLVIDVHLRGGRPIDPGDDQRGTRDRPPTARREAADAHFSTAQMPATPPSGPPAAGPSVLISPQPPADDLPDEPPAQAPLLELTPAATRPPEEDRGDPAARPAPADEANQPLDPRVSHYRRRWAEAAAGLTTAAALIELGRQRQQALASLGAPARPGGWWRLRQRARRQLRASPLPDHAPTVTLR